MSNHKRFFLLGSILLVAALLFTFSPMRSGTAHAATNSAVTFANNHWACLQAACTSKVKAQGDAQPNYQCSEFVARSLATEGYIPGLSSTSSQNAYWHYYPGNGKEYDLLAITPGIAPGEGTLANFLTTFGYFKNVGKNVGSASPGDAVVFENYNGSHVLVPQHVVLITSSNYTVSSIRIDAHNSARYDMPLSKEIAGFNSWYVLQVQF